jgi:hypothetical protein
MRIVLFWDFTRRVVVLLYRLFGKKVRSQNVDMEYNYILRNSPEERISQQYT